MSVGAIRGEHVSIEQIAAFLDGRLSPSERERVTVHLAECEDCYELFAETARYLREEEHEPASEEPAVEEGGRVLRPAPARWRRTGWLAVTFGAAAAALTGILIWTPAGDFLHRDPPTVAELAASLPPASTLSPSVESSWEDHGWPVARGGGSVVGADEELSFQIGVRMLEMEIALAAGETELARRLARDLEELLDELDSAELLVVLYGGNAGLGGALEAGAPRSDLLDLHRQGDQLLGGGGNERRALVEADWYALGKWVGAAHLAALSGDTAFFADRPRRRDLRRLADEGFPPTIEHSLRRLLAWTTGDVGDHLAGIEGELQALIATAGGAQG